MDTTIEAIVIGRSVECRRFARRLRLAAVSGLPSRALPCCTVLWRVQSAVCSVYLDSSPARTPAPPSHAHHRRPCHRSPRSVAGHTQRHCSPPAPLGLPAAPVCPLADARSPAPVCLLILLPRRRARSESLLLLLLLHHLHLLPPPCSRQRTLRRRSPLASAARRQPPSHQALLYLTLPVLTGCAWHSSVARRPPARPAGRLYLPCARSPVQHSHRPHLWLQPGFWFKGRRHSPGEGSIQPKKREGKREKINTVATR